MTPAALATSRRNGRTFRFCWIVLLFAGGLTLRGTDETINGAVYRSLSDVAAQYGMKAGWEAPEKTMELKSQYCTIEATANERTLRINNQALALGAPVLLRGSMLFLSKRDFDNNIFPLLSPGQIPSAVPLLHRIIIDPGHGGEDPGTQNRTLGTNEKTNTLDVGLRLADELRKRGYEVIMTRTKDVTFNRRERPILANNDKGDLYLSIHFNEAPEASVSGVETWILTPPWQPSSTQPKSSETDKLELAGNRFDYWNTIVGFSVERAVTRELGVVNRGVKRARYDVLTPLNMPGLLVECGFLSNPAEAAKIITPEYRQKIATALADGIDLYKATLDHLRPRPLMPPTLPTQKK
jgi:N-acetylmuramoyl-L-alanine amidase